VIGEDKGTPIKEATAKVERGLPKQHDKSSNKEVSVDVLSKHTPESNLPSMGKPNQPSQRGSASSQESKVSPESRSKTDSPPVINTGATGGPPGRTTLEDPGGTNDRIEDPEARSETEANTSLETGRSM